MNRSRLVGITLGAIALAAAVGCTPGGDFSGRLTGQALAGPICPVVTDPPQSGCDDRPVAGATLVILDEDGAQVATVTTGSDGRFALDLAAGTYELQPQPVDGLMGTAPPVSVTVIGGRLAQVTVSYDTGIR